MAIINAKIPPALLDECGEVYQNLSDDCSVKDVNPKFDIEVVYPPGLNKTNNLPLSGGSILKLTYSNSEFVPGNYTELFNQELSQISSFKPSLDTIANLASLRLIFNSILRKVGRKESIRKKSKLPQIFISTYKGDDSSFAEKSDQYVAGLITICEISYIPLEIIEKIIELTFENLDIKNLAGLTGSSGISFSNLGSSQIYKQVMEIFPIYNISEQDIEKRTLFSAQGGFYTFDPDGFIYIKMPDLSGKNSFGISSDIFTERNFYIETNQNNLLYRVKLDGYSIPPSIDFAEEIPTEFPENGDLDIIIEANKNLTGCQAYLSQVDDSTPINISGVETSSDALELSTAPLLTVPVEIGFNPTLDNELPLSKISSKIGQYLGEQNRPEVLLFDSSRRKSKKNNDNKYTNPKLSEARELFVENRPKIYRNDQIPTTWLKSQNLSLDNSGNYLIKFSSTELGKIDKTNLSEIKFVLYILDNHGQLARGPKVISLSLENPSLENISPDGFIETREVSPFKTVKFLLTGENLNTVKYVIIEDVSKTYIKKFEKGQNDNYGLFVNNNTVSFVTYKNIGSDPFNLVPSTRHQITVETEYGKRSKFLEFYVSDGENNLIEKTQTKAVLSPIEFTFDTTGTQITSNIPVKSGLNATIKIKSRNKYFDGKYKLFAYLATDVSNKLSLSDIDLLSNLKDISLGEKNLTISTGFEFEFSSQPIGQDFYKISKNKAAIKLPGSNFKSYNLGSLINSINKYYLVITNQSILEIINPLNSSTNLSDDQYSILQFGDEENYAFIYPPYIYGIAAVLSGSKYVANFEINRSSFANVYDRLGLDVTKDFESSKVISTFDGISKLAIIFYGDGDNNYKKRCDFYLGQYNINKYLSGSIETLDLINNLQVAFFDGIKISEQANLVVYINKKNKDYDFNSNNEVVVATGTLDITNSSSELSDEGITIKSSFNPIESFSSILPSRGSGVALSREDDYYYFINPISLKSNFNIELKSLNGPLNISNNLTENIENLNSELITINQATFIQNNNFLSDGINSIAYLSLNFYEPQIISFNKPEIIEVSEGINSEPSEDPNKVIFLSGKDYTARVKSKGKDFVLLFNDTIVVNPKNIKKIGENEWKVVFVVPKKLVSFKCPKICVSFTNEKRKNVKFLLNDSFVIDVDKKMEGILGGITKNKIPNYIEFINIIRDFPLRFVNIKLDQVSIPTDLINTICDMSFHLAADLKIALNGFQILMTPIQIIFCIIDVICALINPIKLARAVIRLFQCLYDLILILPVICVPVMLLQLILHLLILLECLLGKILTIVIVINEIINILNSSNFLEAIKSLEELLSEYLFDLNVSLSVLEPIVAILSIFLQLLGLTFRFPCSITDDLDQYFCLDGTMVAGLIAGKIINTDSSYNFNNLIPVGQSYSEKTLEEAIIDNTSDPLIDPSNNDVCAIKNENQTYLQVMNPDQSTLRSIYGGSPTATGNFNLTFGVSTTKSRKGLGRPDLIKFQFKEKGRNGFFNNKKIIEPDQNLDGLIYLTKNLNNILTIETGDNRNFISAVDNHEFINIFDNTASVKPLVLNIEIPIEEINPETGQKEVVGTQIIPRTFDNIPSLAIIDEQNDVYFIEPNGIKFNNSGAIDTIIAKVINKNSANKLKFVKEDTEIDTDLDGYNDEEAAVFEFPQIYFFDMRSIAEDIETKCGIDFFNNDLLQNNPDDILSIVKKAQDCVLGYQGYFNSIVINAQNKISIGEVPDLINISDVQNESDSINKCLNEVINDICIYVINTLNSQFKILDDIDNTSLNEFPITEVSTELADEFEITGPSLTGAREYSNGIGDSANIKTGNFATIEVVPRDSYDNIMPGDFSEKIQVEIISDTTGSAYFIESDGKKIIKVGETYIAKINANNPGIVKIRAKICGKTIQAVTYAEIANQISQQLNSKQVDCVPEAGVSAENPEFALGQLAKIDRILTIFFIEESKVIVSNIDSEIELAKADPQAFGTILEN